MLDLDALYRSLAKHRLRCFSCRIAAKDMRPLIRECAEGIALREAWETATRESAAPQTTAEAVLERDAQGARD